MTDKADRTLRRAERDRIRVEKAEEWLRGSRYRTRRARRRLTVVGGGAVSLVWGSAVVCWFLAPSTTAMWTTFALGATALVVYGWAASVLVVAAQGVIGAGNAHLDERQQAERNRIYALAHRGTFWMLLATAAGMTLVRPGDDLVIEIPSAAALMLAVAVLVTHLTLPHLIAGWRAADPVLGDED
ncbi:hypothetical protein [Planomonospora sp. ID82291]|uniref:hypothetical protein n=1 Tax=Planomonospora sp. ID82291 TaxID=2738136 RepID=UPI0018C3E920|nr:hypothetical protein [Planomonospora sp. ID82291]MBG0812755.1 hypothetical protein [Planomonospora sp. ID82291]